MDNDKTIIKPRPGGRGGRPPTGDSDKTVIRPRPGGQQAAVVAANPDATVIRPRRATGTPLLMRELPGIGDNELVNAAGTLLSLATQLAQVQIQIDVEQLHAQTVRQVQAFQRSAAQAGLERESIDHANYLLCSLIDETVLNTHWGEHSSWSQKTLLGRFFQQTSGGERVFELIDEALGAVRKDYDFLELAYLCLSLGFEGKYRVDPRGRDHIERLRSDLYIALDEARDRYRKDLSPDVAPATGIRHRLHSFLPVWVSAAVLGVIAFGLFSFLSGDLNRHSDEVQARLAALIPSAPVAAADAAEPIERPEPVQLRTALHDETERNIVRVDEYPNRVSIVLTASDLFPSGSASVAEAYRPVLDKIATVLQGIDGRIVVIGHTDDEPIRSTRFPSNWHLSLARATSVSRHLGEFGNLGGRIVPEGRADTEPVADNSTAAGRAQNRRVVVDVYYGGA